MFIRLVCINIREWTWNGRWQTLSTDSSKHVNMFLLSNVCIDTLLFYRIKVIHLQHKLPAKRHKRLNEYCSIGQWEPLNSSGYHLSQVNEVLSILIVSAKIDSSPESKTKRTQTWCSCPFMNYTWLKGKQIDI